MLPKKADRNFDRLIHRFEKVVYDTAKGGWRLQLLKEDLAFLREGGQRLTIWDAGCGFGQMSLWFAENGHLLTLCDVSEKMLEHARARFTEAGISAQFHHRAAQALCPELPGFDVVIFHAVLEWLAEPLLTLSEVIAKVNQDGYLSLMFYNRNAMVYKNVLKGGWRLQQVLNDSYLGKGKKLSPPNPQYPHEIIAYLQQSGFTVIKQTGIRVFHDYLPEEALNQSAADELFALERRYCRAPGFWEMGRYVHLLAQKSP